MAKPKTLSKPELERIYTIPLKIKWERVPRYKRANKAIKTIKEFLVRHMKIRDRNLNKIKIDQYLNEAVWFRGIKKPPIRIKIRAIKNPGEDLVRAELAELPNKLKFKKLKAERVIKKATEITEKKKAVKKPVEEAPKPEKTEKEKKEEKEKVAAGAEAAKKLEKTAAKQVKHATKSKAKEPKRQQRKALVK